MNGSTFSPKSLQVRKKPPLCNGHGAKHLTWRLGTDDVRGLTCGVRVDHLLTKGKASYLRAWGGSCTIYLRARGRYIHKHTVEHLTWGLHVDHVLGLSSFFGGGVVVVEHVQHSLRVLLLLHLGDVGTLQQLRPWFWHSLSMSNTPGQWLTETASIYHTLSVSNIPCLCEPYPATAEHKLSF